MRNKRVKQETRVSEVEPKSAAVRRKLNCSDVAVQNTSVVLPKPQTSVAVSPDGVQTTEPARASLPRTWQHVPVIGMDRKPLMPTTPWRAARWIKTRKATPFWSKGVFCVRLNQEAGKEKQEVCVGIDPGSKKEGLTVKSEAHTFLNIQTDAVTWVKDAVEARRNMRRARRFRKTPCRANRKNRARGCLPPSTKARWQWKLRIVAQLAKVFPVTDFVVEDIKARTTGKRRWDKSFSPLEVGKAWFYEELSRLGRVHLKQGWETAEMRMASGLKKSKSKMSNVFEAHCVDSWVLANWYIGGHIKPENTQMLCISPIRLHRRQLHMLQPASGGVRKPYGGTRSLGFKRGSLVTHPKHRLVYVGGNQKGRISLHSLSDGKRICLNAKPAETRVRTYNTWRIAIPPSPKDDGLLAKSS